MSTAGAVRALGAHVELDLDDDLIRVTGVGLRGLTPPAGPVDCGNAGTLMRLISGILAGQTGRFELVGDAASPGGRRSASPGRCARWAHRSRPPTATRRSRSPAARCRINPGYGLWVVPGGFVDMGEVVEEAVVRETQEETYLTVRPAPGLLNIYSYPDHRTIIAAYVTEYVSGELGAGNETLEARVFGLKEIPWPQIAFSSTKEALREYISRFGQ